MSGRRVWSVLLITLGVGLGLFLLVAVGGTLIGATRPERVAYAYQARLGRTPHEVWTRLRFPDKVTTVRESASGSRYEAAPGDTSGRLILYYAPDSIVVDATYRPNALIMTVETLAPDGDGTFVRVQTRAKLRAGWHRLLFPGMLKRETMERIRDQARSVGEPEPAITEIAVPPAR